ncbi:M64 family metallopeptidase [Seonamhaeicola algicola]|uniref:M64 family metallopeptidase n=1 Tax=Seonamhaeicola algicola TaxID=1719036 RepID=UPI001FE5CA79|nr:M64 family metallopeptidase [Seonamhaeicola algicola]
MKHLLHIIVIFISLAPGFAQNFDVEAIKIAGDNTTRINLVILSEGYQTQELNTFILDATNFSNYLFSQSPFLEYANYFNVYAVKVPSNESGADHPGTGNVAHESGWPVPTQTVDTYFNATYDAFGNHFLLYYEIDGLSANNTQAKIETVLANNFPTYDQALILVNSPYYGGSGGKFPMASTGSSSLEIAVHELGHSLFDLKDEYYPGDELAAEAINMTQDTNPNTVKWKNWIGTNNIGIHQHTGNGNASLWYKPRHAECKMEVLNKPFCAVCKEGMIEKTHSLITPIESFSPEETTLEALSFPLNFQLNLIKPIPNTLESVWTLNNVNYANNVDDVSINETNLSEGNNTLSVTVTDNSNMLKVDNHETFHIYNVNWTINYSALGVETISSSSHSFKIKMFPNPTDEFLNFTIENNNSQTLRVVLNTIDGKKIISKKLNTSTQLNTSYLKTGIYIANIYANNTLIASKKVVKH